MSRSLEVSAGSTDQSPRGLRAANLSAAALVAATFAASSPVKGEFEAVTDDEARAGNGLSASGVLASFWDDPSSEAAAAVESWMQARPIKTVVDSILMFIEKLLSDLLVGIWLSPGQGGWFVSTVH